MKFTKTPRLRTEEMAGSATLDKWRPYRIGENLARAEHDHDDVRREYYGAMLDHMDATDLSLAEKGLSEMRAALGGGS